MVSTMYSDCQPMDHIYSDLLTKTPKQVLFHLPPDLGTGTIRYTTTKNNIMIMDVRSVFYSDIPIYGPSIPEYLNLFFCFRESMAWEIKGRPGSICIECGNSYIYRGHGRMEYSEYQKDSQFHFTGFKIPWSGVTQILHDCLNEQEITNCKKRLTEIAKISVTPEINRILMEIMELPQPGSGLENMYFEGRMLSLLALYFQEILESSAGESCPCISRTDQAALLEVKQQIDERPDFVPNCGLLARQVHMSPSKFTRMFSSMFGMPVHTYVIHQRLKQAARMLQETDLTVSEISARVGYAKPSNFAAAFKKTYGLSPKSYQKTDFG